MDFNTLHDEMKGFVEYMTTQDGGKQVFVATKVD